MNYLLTDEGVTLVERDPRIIARQEVIKGNLVVDDRGHPIERPMTPWEEV